MRRCCAWTIVGGTRRDSLHVSNIFSFESDSEILMLENVNFSEAF
jgi:hypothetical protein